MGRTCYDCLLRGYLFSLMSILPSYVSLRTLPIPGGPVRFLSWSPVLFSCALSSGCPYPCSSFTFRFLSGVGSIFDRHLIHHPFVIPADSSISSRQFSSTVSCSLWLIMFYQVPSYSMMTHHVVLIYHCHCTFPYAYSMQYKVSCRVQVLPWETSLHLEFVSIF